MGGFLPSATKLQRLSFYTCLSVILFTGGGLPQCMLGCHPPRTRHPPEQTLPPRADTPPQSRPPRSRPLLGPGTLRDQASPHRDQAPSLPRDQAPPRQQTATVADGTHPTGMHSCCLLNFNYVSLSNIELDLVLFHWPNLCFPKDFPKLAFKNEIKCSVMKEK